MVEQVLDLNGTNQTQLLAPPIDSSDKEPTDQRIVDVDPADYPPGRLKVYWSKAEEGAGYHSDKAYTTKWLEYWANKGRAADVLAELEKEAFDANRYMGSDLAFDGAFAVALKYLGRTAAYPWLVRAHDNSYGWLKWMTSEEEAFARMDRLLANYPDKWKQFIIDTAHSKQVLSERPNKLTVGFGRLIHFLLRAGQSQMAKECALAMVGMFKDETSVQPLTISTNVL